MSTSGKARTAEIVTLGEARGRRAPSEVPLDNAGAMLRAAREDAGHSLEDVAEAINVKVERLVAIETMQVQALPGAPYALGFVRAYAGFLDLPVEPMVARFREEAGWRKSGAVPVIKAPKRPAREREVGLVGVLIVVGFAVWAVWQVVGGSPAEDAALPPGFPIADRTATPEVVPEVTTNLDADLAATPPARIPTDADPRAAGGPVPDAPTAQQGYVPFLPLVSSPLRLAEDAAADVPPATPSPRVRPAPEPQAGPVETARPDAATREGAAEDPVAQAGQAGAEDDLNTLLLREVLAERARAEAEEAATPAPRTVEAAGGVVEGRVASDASAPREAVPIAPAPTPGRVPSGRQPAVLVEPVPPVYPTRCERRADDEEAVTVRFTVTRTGRVSGPEVAEATNRCFERAALAAVSRFAYEPATVNGRPVPDGDRLTRIVFQKP